MCTQEKQKEIESTLETIRAKSDKIVNELSSIKEESQKCLENVGSWRDVIRALGCVNFVSIL